jgi:uncharacterized protein with HEPN domain
MKTEYAYLRDILDACMSITDRTAGMNFEAFDAPSLVQDSVYYRLTVIGEAVRYLTPPTLELMPEIPWQQIKAMRNVLVHDYDGVDALIAWDVIENHLPPRVGAIQRVLPEGD